MKNKKILFVINTLDRGGAERSLINLFDERDFSDSDVYLLILTGEAVLADEIPEFVHVINKRLYASKGHLILRSLKALFYREYIFTHFKYLMGNLRRMIGEKRILPDKLLWDAISCSAPSVNERFDRAIAYTEGGSAYYVAERVNAGKKTVLMHIDYKLSGYCRQLDRDVYSRFDRIGAVSKDAERSFAEVYPELGERLFIFENPLNTRRILKLCDEKTQIGFTTNGLKIFTAERLVAQKSADVSVEAAAILKDKGIGFEWIFAGDGPERKKLAELTDRLGLTDKVVLAGEMDNPYPLMKACDMYVQVTAFEGKSMSVREASFLGKPVMVSDRSGNTSVADGEIVVRLTPEDIADAIITFAENRE